MARVAQAPKTSGATKRRKFKPFGGLTSSLVGKLFLLFLVFVTVPIILYSEFRQADAEKRRLLLESVRAQGRLIAQSLRPLLERGDPSPLPGLNDAIKPFSSTHAGIKVLFRPASQHGLEDFFFVASEPTVPAAALKEERDRLIERGVLERLAQSCQVQIPFALRNLGLGGQEELLTSITPITTKAGCWAVITTHTSSEMLGTAIDQPYWMTLEVRVAVGIYLGMAVFTFGLFYSIWRGIMHFSELARGIGEGRLGAGGFAAQNEVPELGPVAEEFDRMTVALHDSAESIRRAAEDNAHAFKTPIAIMRQALEPLNRIIGPDQVRGRRSLEVAEEAIDRLEYLVASARQLDRATAELLDPPRERIDLSRLLERMLSAYATSLTRKRLALTGTIARGVVVRAGEDLLETVIENLIENAIEVSPDGGELAIDLGTEKGMARLVVRDHGPGVKEADLERIFERYVSLRPKTGGGGEEPTHFGIGLWIVRRNLEAVGGRVWAENWPGGGLAVNVQVPLSS